jgi:hypothetical protein
VNTDSGLLGTEAIFRILRNAPSHVNVVTRAARGVRVLAVRGGPEERRRVVVAHLPHRLPEAALRVAEALRAATTEAT